jgi:hypothetical protein
MYLRGASTSGRAWLGGGGTNVFGNQNGFFLIWAGCHKCNLFVVFLLLCKCMEVDGIFPMSRYMQFLDLQLESYGISKISTLLWGMPSSIANEATFAQKCQNLPNLPKDNLLEEL